MMRFVHEVMPRGSRPRVDSLSRFAMRHPLVTSGAVAVFGFVGFDRGDSFPKRSSMAVLLGSVNLILWFPRSGPVWRWTNRLHREQPCDDWDDCAQQVEDAVREAGSASALVAGSPAERAVEMLRSGYALRDPSLSAEVRERLESLPGWDWNAAPISEAD